MRQIKSRNRYDQPGAHTTGFGYPKLSSKWTRRQPPTFDLHDKGVRQTNSRESGCRVSAVARGRGISAEEEETKERYDVPSSKEGSEPRREEAQDLKNFLNTQHKVLSSRKQIQKPTNMASITFAKMMKYGAGVATGVASSNSRSNSRKRGPSKNGAPYVTGNTLASKGARERVTGAIGLSRPLTVNSYAKNSGKKVGSRNSK